MVHQAVLKTIGLAALSQAAVGSLYFMRGHAQDPDAPCTTLAGPRTQFYLQGLTATRHALASADANTLSPLTLIRLLQLLYPCRHSYCQKR